MLSCAGAYVSGAAGSNSCPAGSARIETEAACRTAAAAAGKTPRSTFVETYSTAPRGCYYDTGSDDAYFNTHAVGAGGISGYQLLCAALATTAGAPPRTTPRHVCVCIGARVCHTHTCATLHVVRRGERTVRIAWRGRTLRWCGMGTGIV